MIGAAACHVWAKFRALVLTFEESEGSKRNLASVLLLSWLGCVSTNVLKRSSIDVVLYIFLKLRKLRWVCQQIGTLSNFLNGLIDDI